MDPNQPPNQSDVRPSLTTYEELAKMIDHSLLRPELTEEQVAEGCNIARQYQVASVTVRPCDVDFAVRQMQDSGVPVGSVAGFPHGSSTLGWTVAPIVSLSSWSVLREFRLVPGALRFVENRKASLTGRCRGGPVRRWA